jgi:hypothetical protein
MFLSFHERHFCTICPPPVYPSVVTWSALDSYHRDLERWERRLEAHVATMTRFAAPSDGEPNDIGEEFDPTAIDRPPEHVREQPVPPTEHQAFARRPREPSPASDDLRSPLVDSEETSPASDDRRSPLFDSEDDLESIDSMHLAGSRGHALDGRPCSTSAPPRSPDQDPNKDRDPEPHEERRTDFAEPDAALNAGVRDEWLELLFLGNDDGAEVAATRGPDSSLARVQSAPSGNASERPCRPLAQLSDSDECRYVKKRLCT